MMCVLLGLADIFTLSFAFKGNFDLKVTCISLCTAPHAYGGNSDVKEQALHFVLSHL